MEKVFKPGPRPAIAFAIVLGILAVLLLALGPAGSALETLKGLGLLAAVFAAVLVNIYASRIVIGDGYIAWKSGILPERRMALADIERAKIGVLAERDHPVMVELHSVQGERMRIRLKAFRKADVQQLLAVVERKLLGKQRRERST